MILQKRIHPGEAANARNTAFVSFHTPTKASTRGNRRYAHTCRFLPENSPRLRLGEPVLSSCFGSAQLQENAVHPMFVPGGWRKLPSSTFFDVLPCGMGIFFRVTPSSAYSEEPFGETVLSVFSKIFTLPAVWDDYQNR